MSMTLSGNGTITGLVSGGLPDGTVLPADLSTGGPYWDTSGNLLVGKTSATANGGDVQVSKGITFPATQVACSDANTLDDYEEGTWQPTWTGGGSLTGSFTYTKIGRVVYIDAQMNVAGTTSGDLGGLPFSGAYDGRDCGSVGYHNVNGSTWNVLKINGTGFRFYAGGTQQQAVNGSDIRYSFWYTV